MVKKFMGQDEDREITYQLSSHPKQIQPEELFNLLQIKKSREVRNKNKSNLPTNPLFFPGSTSLPTFFTCSLPSSTGAWGMEVVISS